MKSKILGLLIATLVIIQFFQIDKSKPEINTTITFAKVENPPDQVLNLLQNACYDCHSLETEYPWYASIQPVAWWLRSHIRGAQMNMNFSEWGTYPVSEHDDIKRECAEEIEDDHMPPSSFRLMHPEAKLSSEEKQILIDWLRQ